MDATEEAATAASTDVTQSSPSEGGQSAPSEATAEPTSEATAEATQSASEMAVEAKSEAPDTASDNPQDAAEDGRPLGAADKVAGEVDQAVDRMNEGIAASEDSSMTSAAEDSGMTAATDDSSVTVADAELAPPAEDVTTELTTDTQMAEMTAEGGADAPDAEAVAADAEPAADDVATPAIDATAEVAPEAAGGNGAAAPIVSPPVAPAPRVYDGPEPTTMEELLNEQATEIRSLKHGDVVEGSVVRIDKDEILVDIGAKSEGVISNRELYGRNAESQPQLNIGDVVLVYVLQPESPEGHAVLSLRRAGLERKWRSMQEQLDAGVIIEAPVIDHNKGGLIVDCGIRGFVPISQIVDFPRRPQNEQPRDAAQEIAEKLQPYVGRKLRLKILEVNRKANRLILSEKVALYEERREKRDELFSSLQVGQKVTGTVRSIAPFGVFIDLGGIDGLVHKSELSWNKVNNPEAGYRVGEEVEAEVIDINHERGRISLSIRRLQPDPWHSTVADLKVGDLIDGTVTKIVNFGAFVRVRDGLEGLIHISELSHQRVAHPGDVVHEGQTIKLKIISLDQERHRLGLSLKQAEEAPARVEPAERRERRPRTERGPGYDASQAVQEPEGGIDNTLAAAFAQVRQQMEETEAARGDNEQTESQSDSTSEVETSADTGGATDEAAATEATAEAPATEATAEAPADAVAEAMVEMPSAETDETDAEARPARKGRGSAKAKADEGADADAGADAAPEATADQPAGDAATADDATAGDAKPEAKAKRGRASAEPADDAAAEEPAADDTATEERAGAAATSAEQATDEGPADAAPDETSADAAPDDEDASA